LIFEVAFKESVSL